MRARQLIHRYRQLAEQPLTVVDLETTGSRPGRDRAMEIALVRASLKGGVERCQTTLIAPGVPVPPYIAKFTGINNGMLLSAPPSERVWPAYLPLLREGILTAHNVAFDYGFIAAEYHRLGIHFQRLPEERFCTVALARLMLPDLPSRSLPKLVARFQFPVGRSHRAEADAMACWLLAERLLREIDTTDDDALLVRFGREWIPIDLAAQLLKRSTADTRILLEQEGIECRSSRRDRTPMYRRESIERVLDRLGDDVV